MVYLWGLFISPHKYTAKREGKTMTVRHLGRRVVAAALTMVVSCGICSFASDTKNKSDILFSDDFQSYTSIDDVYKIWEASEISTVDPNQQIFQYETNGSGLDIIKTNNISKKDARISVKVKSDEWKTTTDGKVSIYLRYSATGDGYYRFEADPSQNKVTLYRKNSTGTETSMDTYTFRFIKDEYTLGLSAKDGYIRGEIDGTVWCMAYDEIPLDAGDGAIATDGFSAVLTEGKMTGENRYYYNDFASGRAFDDIETLTKVNAKGTLSVSDGKLHLIKEKQFNIGNDLAWENTKLEIKAKEAVVSEGTELRGMFFVRTGVGKGVSEPYLSFLSSNAGASKLAMNDPWSEEKLIKATTYANALSLGTDFNLVVETSTSGTKPHIKTTFNNNVLWDADADAVCKGGVRIEALSRQELVIDDISLADISSASENVNDIYQSGSFETWDKSLGDVDGECTIGYPDNVTVFNAELKNGKMELAEAKLMLKDGEFRNVEAEATVNTAKISDDSMAGFYLRYKDSDNNLFAGICKTGIILKEQLNGTEIELGKANCEITPNTDYKLGAAIKDGAYMIYLNDICVLDKTFDTKNKNMSGKFGLCASKLTASFDNVSIKRNINDWKLKSVDTSVGSEVNFVPSYATSDHTKINVMAKIDSFDSSQGAIQIGARVGNNKSYTAHIYTSQETLMANLISHDWSTTFYSSVNLGDKIELGKYNKISLETETLKNKSVKISLYVNDNLMKEFIDETVKFLPENGHMGYKVRYKYNNNTTAVPIESLWAEDLTYTGVIDAKLKASENRLKAGEKLEITVDVKNCEVKSRNLIPLAAIYDSDGMLIGLESVELVVPGGEDMLKTLEFIVPNGANGGRIKIMCIDAYNNMEMICNSILLK